MTPTPMREGLGVCSASSVEATWGATEIFMDTDSMLSTRSGANARGGVDERLRPCHTQQGQLQAWRSVSGSSRQVRSTAQTGRANAAAAGCRSWLYSTHRQFEILSWSY